MNVFFELPLDITFVSFAEDSAVVSDSSQASLTIGGNKGIRLVLDWYLQK